VGQRWEQEGVNIYLYRGCPQSKYLLNLFFNGRGFARWSGVIWRIIRGICLCLFCCMS
jgi:hypothetical protein